MRQTRSSDARWAMADRLHASLQKKVSDTRHLTPEPRTEGVARHLPPRTHLQAPSLLTF